MSIGLLDLRDRIDAACGRDAAALWRAVEDEVADVLGFALAISKRFDVDILPALERKWHLPECSLR